MIFIVDKKENLNIESKGHFGLQYKWMISNLESIKYKEIPKEKPLSLLSLFLTQFKKKIFFPNLSVYDRNSLLITLLVLFSPFSKKKILCHSVSKINFLNFVFFKFTLNCEYYVYSKSLCDYIEKCTKGSKSCKVYLGEYPNARCMKDMISNNNKKIAKFDNLFRDNCINFITWGHALSKIDSNKVDFLLKNKFIENLIIVGKNDLIDDINKEFPAQTSIVKNASDFELSYLLSKSDVNLMASKDNHDYYNLKQVASGVYLTSLMFSLPSLIWSNLKIHYKEFGLDSASLIILDKEQIHSNKEFFKKKLINKDNLYRKKIVISF